jgi:S-adenosylmethionine synthetase
MILEITSTGSGSVDSAPIEIVEKKGLGHPDTICDSVMDISSRALVKAYLSEYGTIPHFNLDKALLAAGQVKTRFTGGKVLKPMTLYYGDRATFKVDKKVMYVTNVIENAIRGYMSSNFPNLNVKDNLELVSTLKKGSSSLVDIFSRENQGTLPSNDTSAAVGYYPTSKLENSITSLEHLLTSSPESHKHPEWGQDVKLMGMRRNQELYLTLAMAFVDKHISNLDSYIDARERLKDIAKRWLAHTGFGDNEIYVNTADDLEDPNSIYLTVTGLSAENGDSGQVGRGNNPIGLIPQNRPMSAEALSGKNPVSHVGKIYNAYAFDIAKKIHQELSEPYDVYVHLVSQIGKPIHEPFLCWVRLNNHSGIGIENQRIARDIIKDAFTPDAITEFCIKKLY